MGPIQSIGDFIGMILRRFWVMASVFFLGVVVTIIAALNMDRVYETIAVIEFDVPAVQPGDGAGATQITSVARQLQLIEQRLMARDSVVDIIERYQLFADAPDVAMADRVTTFRQSVSFQPISAVQSGPVGSDGRPAAMLITVRLGDPVLVADLANDLARRVLDDTFRLTSERTSEALRLFREQEALLAAESREVEAEISAFKVEHQDALPEGQTFRRDEFQRLQERLLDIDRSLRELERERRVVEAFGTPSVLGEEAPGTAATSPTATVEAELRLAELELARARQVLAPSNREIQALEAQVEVLTARAEQLRADRRERFLSDIDSQVDLLMVQREIILERLENLQVAMLEAPGVEVELGAMELDLTRVHERYSVAATRLAEAENAQMLLEAQQDGSMRLLEPAIVPEFPVGPSRTRTAVLGIGVAGLMALVVGFILELMNPVMRSAKAVTNRTGLTPVVSIPEIRSSAERMLGVWRQLASAAAFVLFCVVVVFGATQLSEPFEEFMADMVGGLGLFQSETEASL